MHDFSHGHYRDILLALQNAGYVWSPFSKAPDSEKRVYLRHDIDLTPEKIPAMADIEYDLRIQATYFIRAEGRYYNPFEAGNISIFRKLIEQGHHLGLHVDGIKRDANMPKSEVTDMINEQFEKLQNTFPVERIVSFHQASPLIQGADFSEEGYISTYAPEFFDSEKRQMWFLSDSRGAWGKDGDPVSWLSRDTKKSLHLLVHPIWWGDRKPLAKDHLEYWAEKNCPHLMGYLKEDFPRVFTGM